LETTTKKLYEAMFLVDSAQAGSDWDGTMAAINRVLERADAEVVTVRKWADRKLAYEIDHKSRGTYILCFFKADPSKISGMEKDVLLSEKIMRAMITTTDGRSENVLDKDIKGESPAPKDQEFDSSSDRRDRSDRIRSVSKSDAEEVKAAAAKVEAKAKAEAKAEEEAADKTEADAAEKTEAEAAEKTADETDAVTPEKTSEEADVVTPEKTAEEAEVVTPEKTADEADVVAPEKTSEEAEVVVPEETSGDAETTEETPAS
jgi:small subunit ribosomal protein S6